jgi:hypothetical protein
VSDNVSINIRIEGDLSMEVRDLWPDGDAPNPITAAAIVALLEKDGSKGHVLRDWCLIDDVDVIVCVDQPNPAYKQDEVLFGEAPPRWLHDRAEAWDWRASRRVAAS